MQKITKSITAIIVATMLFLIVTPILALTTDTKPPVLQELSILTTQVKAGEELEVKLKAYDDVSGLGRITLCFHGYTTDGPHKLNALPNEFDVQLIGDKLIIPENVAPGNYLMSQAILYDQAGNDAYYVAYSFFCHSATDIEPTFEGSKKVKWGNLMFEVVPSGNDFTAPELQSISINKQVFIPGETAVFSIKASDKESGVSRAVIEVSSTNNSTQTWLNSTRYDSFSDSLIVEYEVPQYAGEFYVSAIFVYDNCENYQWTNPKFQSVAFAHDYYKGAVTADMYDIYLGHTAQYICPGIVFTVVSDLVDLYPPTLLKLSFNKTGLMAPGYLELTAIVRDDASGVVSGYAKVTTTDNLSNDSPLNIVLYDSGEVTADGSQIFVGTLHISQYYEAKDYTVVQVTLYDGTGKGSTYVYDNKLAWSKNYPPLPNKATFSVTNDHSFFLVSSTLDQQLSEKIKQAPNDAKIAIDSSFDSIVSSEVFAAIAGTDKTIYIEADSITWIFNGQDIVNVKSIDTRVGLQLLDDYQHKEELSEAFETALILSFPPNEELPGKALIQVKIDYLTKKYLGQEQLAVYFIRGDDYYDPIAYDVRFDENGYYEFYILHNSTFALSNKKIAEKFVSRDTSTLILNNSIPTQATSRFWLYAGSVIAVLLFSIVIVIIAMRRKPKKAA